VEGCLTEVSLSPADGNVRLTYLEHEILRQADAPQAGSRPGDDSGTIRRRGIVLCVSEEVADSLLRWMKQCCAALSSLNPARLNLTSRAHRGKERHESVALSQGQGTTSPSKF